jgi:tetratricopeptide (TPR) repeat protein
MHRLFGQSLAVRAALLLLVLVILGFTGYYLWDRYDESETSVLGSEARAIEEYLRTNPSDTDAWIALANISLQQRQYDRAITQYSNALDLDENLATAHMGIGLAYMKKSDSARAVGYLSQAIAISEDPESASGVVSLATAHYYLGKVYLEKGDLDQAFEELTLALAYNRTNADAIFLLGQVHEAQGNVDEAEAQYVLALRLVPNFTEAYLQLGDLYSSRGEELKAQYNRAMALLFSGYVDAAVADLESLTAQMTDSADLYWGLAWGYEKLNMRDEAIAAYSEVLRVDPDHLMARGALERLGANMQ